MNPTVLFGEFELTTDEKNRLLIPAEIRKALSKDGNVLFVVIGRNRRPWFYASNYYEFLASEGYQQKLTPSEDLLAFDQYHFARASRVEWDKQGRIVMPEKILSRTKIKRDVTLIGARDHLELWNRADWDQRFEDLMNREAEITLRAEMARLKSGSDEPPRQ